MNTIKLNNGVEMPIIGYGVFQVSPNEAERCVSDALSVGYRMVDTAQADRSGVPPDINPRLRRCAPYLGLTVFNLFEVVFLLTRKLEPILR